MSIGIVVGCDRSMQYGTCAAVFHTGATTEAEAYEVARRAGWEIGAPDYCPAHAPRRAGRGGPRCGNSPRTGLAPGDQQAVADFKSYLLRRAVGEQPTTTEA